MMLWRFLSPLLNSTFPDCFHFQFHHLQTGFDRLNPMFLFIIFSLRITASKVKSLTLNLNGNYSSNFFVSSAYLNLNPNFLKSH